MSVRWLWPGAEHAIAVLQRGARDADPGDLRILKLSYGALFSEGLWTITARSVLPVLYLPASSQLLLGVEVHSGRVSNDGPLIPTGLGGLRVDFSGDAPQFTHFPLPVSHPHGWSALPDGRLILVGSDGDGPVVAALAPDGTVLWRHRSSHRWAGADQLMERRQPPVITTSGVALLTERGVLALDHEGKRRWHARVDQPTFAAGLSDGALLVTAGTRLVHVASGGRQVMEVSLSDPIVTSPVVDREGKIYVATEKRTLHQIV
jgi:hypothetical protein